MTGRICCRRVLAARTAVTEDLSGWITIRGLKSIAIMVVEVDELIEVLEVEDDVLLVLVVVGGAVVVLVLIDVELEVELVLVD